MPRPNWDILPNSVLHCRSFVVSQFHHVLKIMAFVLLVRFDTYCSQVDHNTTNLHAVLNFRRDKGSDLLSLSVHLLATFLSCFRLYTLTVEKYFLGTSKGARQCRKNNAHDERHWKAESDVVLIMFRRFVRRLMAAAMAQEDVCIVAATRTPIGAFQVEFCLRKCAGR